jgi:hypothetical protein
LTIIWGLWLFAEPLTPALIAGGALTLGGIYWASRTKRPAPERRPVHGEAAPRPPHAAVLTLAPDPAAQ